MQMKLSSLISNSHQSFASVFLAFSLFGFLFPHQPHNCGSNGTDAVLHRTNFLLHDGLRRARRAVFLKQSFSPASRAAGSSFTKSGAGSRWSPT